MARVVKNPRHYFFIGLSAVRAKQYDEWTKDFMAKNKNAVNP